ncbi:MAG TPA: cobalamin-dependent protein [Candidatus Wunengus sp. YC61]|uniref:cobalamin-dependent protein n=1 Tax=Candidatus Wunengus sp. YC61 TaxID=3367698 RepID=UPI00402A0041
MYIADLILRRDRVAETVRELIAQYQPDVVVLTAMSFQFATARKIASLIKGLNKNIKIVLGGYHATVMYAKAMRLTHLIISSAEKVKKPLEICWMQLKVNRNGKTFQDYLIGVTVVFYTIHQGRWKILKFCNFHAERRPVYVNLSCYQPGDCGTYACNTS